MEEDFDVGTHLIVELCGIDAEILRDVGLWESLLREAAIEAKATILNSYFHHFGEDYGITGVICLAESHISIHTWPEHRYASLDVFMCGDMNPKLVLDIVKAKVSPKHSFAFPIKRRGVVC